MDYDPAPGRGRPSMLNDPEKVDLFAQAHANGLTTKELAEMFSIGERTVREYKKNPAIKKAALAYIEDRVIRVTRKVDSEIEKRLMDADELDTDVLLKIRKEFLGGSLRQQTQGDKPTPETINAVQSDIEENPAFAAELEELLQKTTAKS